MLEPIHTITTSPGHFGQMSIYAISNKELENYLDASSNDILQKATWVSRFIMEYYGTGIGQQLQEPINTIVTKDQFALITVIRQYLCNFRDIILRMLSPEELKLGQGFPEDWICYDHDLQVRK